jgi:hypothetical protein
MYYYHAQIMPKCELSDGPHAGFLVTEQHLMISFA